MCVCVCVCAHVCVLKQGASGIIGCGLPVKRDETKLEKELFVEEQRREGDAHTDQTTELNLANHKKAHICTSHEYHINICASVSFQDSRFHIYEATFMSRGGRDGGGMSEITVARQRFKMCFCF